MFSVNGFLDYFRSNGGCSSVELGYELADCSVSKCYAIQSHSNEVPLSLENGRIEANTNEWFPRCAPYAYHIVLSILFIILELKAVATFFLCFGCPIFLIIVALAMVFYVAAFLYGIVQISELARALSSANIDVHARMTDGI